ncbi:methyltransferase domain-containing protein [Streptomyces sp. A1136]|uniref:methyltransferase domain-containing protein n=1 Tax=Streptomyces sp. A1136 TaxID=2563102 RepID=UPI001F111820|nr:methyltransferase domain-containing protein [Streptomyces sp. A1136]
MTGSTTPHPRSFTALGHELVAAALLDAAWQDAFDALPRHRFLPDLVWAQELTLGTSVPIDRTEDPEKWMGASEWEVQLVTQWDDGRHTGTAPGTRWTSSMSSPLAVASMLSHLKIGPGMRVLEIGTGTGWSSALLAHRLGDANVTTIEVDQAVAAAARATLEAAGHWPQVICADGALGHQAGAPYDRVIATCGVRSLPSAWVAQTRPGGFVLAPWGTHYTDADNLLRLQVQPDGTARGTFLGPVRFMKLRSQRLHSRGRPPVSDPGVSCGTTDLPLPDHGICDPFTFTASLRLSHVTCDTRTQGDVTTLDIASLNDSSWARAVYRGTSNIAVHQHGPRRLWDELEAVHHWWTAQGEPSWDRYGLTYTPQAQTVWLDHPDNAWPLPR